jgi:HSP20 family protein
MSTKLMTQGYRDPFAMLRRMTSEFDRLFEETAFPTAKWSLFRAQPEMKGTNWLPQIDVFERDKQLVTKVDLPGLKKEDVKVEFNDGYLTISGERKTEMDEKDGEFYRCEREYGSFYRAVPLPEGVKFDDVKASFADGVLEVSVPLPVPVDKKKRQVEIGELVGV